MLYKDTCIYTSAIRQFQPFVGIEGLCNQMKSPKGTKLLGPYTVCVKMSPSDWQLQGHFIPVVLSFSISFNCSSVKWHFPFVIVMTIPVQFQSCIYSVLWYKTIAPLRSFMLCINVSLCRLMFYSYLIGDESDRIYLVISNVFGLVFNMGIAIPGKTVFLIETAPWYPVVGPLFT